MPLPNVISSTPDYTSYDAVLFLSSETKNSASYKLLPEHLQPSPAVLKKLEYTKNPWPALVYGDENSPYLFIQNCDFKPGTEAYVQLRKGIALIDKSDAGSLLIVQNVELDQDVLFRSVLMGCRRIDQRKKQADVTGLKKIDLYYAKKEWDHDADEARQRNLIREYVCNWVDAPPNELNPESYEAEIRMLASELGIEMEVLQQAELEKGGFGGILAVGAGGSKSPRMIKLSYRPDSAKKHVGLVGKGVTFDTGGVSIKNANNMHLMKSDMAGSAVAVAGVALAASLKLPVAVTTIVGLAENNLDANSYLPGAVIKMHSGHSVEIINTDAEGRLILADALSWITSTEKTDVLIDFATLTGACVTALGYAAGGLFTKNDELSMLLSEAGTSSGDRVWSLPMWDDYAELIQTDIADVKNSGGPAAGAITAAKLLEIFTNEHANWAHVDIAGVSMTASPFFKDRTATGFGVGLLGEFFKSLIG